MKFFKEEVAKIKVGDPTEWENFMGPVIAQSAFDRITGVIEKAKEAGGEIIAGGKGESHNMLGVVEWMLMKWVLQAMTPRVGSSSRPSSSPRTPSPSA